MEADWEEYQSYCQQRAAAGLAVVSYHNWARQWIRPRRTHSAKEEAANQQASTSEPSTRKRREEPSCNPSYTGAEASGYNTSRGVAPRWQPKARTGGVAPQTPNRADSSASARPYPAQCLITLAEAGLSPWPAASSRRAGTVEDLNVHRICQAVNQAFLDALPRMGPFTAKQVQALMTTFLTTRVGYGGEDLQRRLEHATESPTQGWYRFAMRTETPAFEAPPLVAYHGSHPEALHALIALGKLVPSSEHVQGARYFEGRPGVYLHSPERRSKAEGYSVQVRLGKPHVYVAVLLETLYDPSQSLNQGKSTHQLIIDYRGVQINAVHLKLATKDTPALGDAVRDWRPDLEIDPAKMLGPAYHCGISVPEGVCDPHSKEPSFEHCRSRTIRLLKKTLTPITPSEPSAELGGVAPQAPETGLPAQAVRMQVIPGSVQKAPWGV